jgi:hypothetical protein
MIGGNGRQPHPFIPTVYQDAGFTHRLIGQCAARYLFDMGHRVVMNVMCLRRYTMELRPPALRSLWR